MNINEEAQKTAITLLEQIRKQSEGANMGYNPNAIASLAVALEKVTALLVEYNRSPFPMHQAGSE